MFALMPYLWIVFMLGLIVATIVAAVLGGKGRKPAKADPTGEQQPTDPLSTEAESEPALDFEDELAQMNQ